jgi:hypothetical protein
MKTGCFIMVHDLTKEKVPVLFYNDEQLREYVKKHNINLLEYRCKEGPKWKSLLKRFSRSTQTTR